MKLSRRKAVAPVIATLLMIAVAVAMSVLLFMWSQNFLSGANQSASGQLGAQNVAAQSSVSIEAAIASTSNANLQIIVRNVGSVSVTLGSYEIVAPSSNAGFKSAIVGQISALTQSQSPSNCYVNLPKGAACQFTITGLLNLMSGDSLSIKVTTSAGTFAGSQLTVP